MSESPSDVDWDYQCEVSDEIWEICESYIDGGISPEQLGIIVDSIGTTYQQQAENETHQFGRHTLFIALAETIDELVEENDDVDWQELAFVLEDLRDMARTRARRTRSSSGDDL